MKNAIWLNTMISNKLFKKLIVSGDQSCTATISKEMKNTEDSDIEIIDKS